MTYAFKQTFLPSSKYPIKAPYTMVPQYITVHNTANDAPAVNEISYMIGNNNQVSYHVSVDDKEVIQAIPFNRNAWHCGDGGGNSDPNALKKGNRISIGVEICYSKSGGVRYGVAEENAVQYIAKLLKQYGWGIDRVKKHQDWNGKYCPHRILSEDRWGSFLNRIKKAMELKESEQQIVEDDDIMKFTNSTTKDAVRDYLKQAVDKGKIDKSWLVKFGQGTMTNGDFEGLKIIILQR
ncbi:peptidoglycan recognition protein family protein [Lysinibacillus fusiformis]|uniref:peptidoglycan recognition protein family protein n=1 Tax=Lysinibacillus fusiformis TaxID=28031 RepID=UPI0000F38F8E|nr:XlyB [Bacillus sp. B14905]PCD82010.1 XlyB [Lysinibacillus fusiformis]SCX51927.1 N-acetylmuramoyl-L-alanine amidase [Lysinibacillus fusiformis]SDB27885.1 N-acetylmuramoyl-L-alanine amidase [Lysinibacillus fusiformis]SFI22494.1 N-acetylmuramoyl-L-alanine amidase [Lysinibacillus fusiformis]